MPDFAEPLARLIAEFRQLPGIGQNVRGACRQVSDRALDLRMAGMADQQHRATVAMMPDDLVMHLADQGADGVEP